MPIISVTDALALAGKPGVLFVDTRSADAWRDATIPGAVHIPVYDYFISASTETGIRAMIAGLSHAFSAVGAERADRVVFFEQTTGMISPRGLWFHDLAGHEGGCILDGGFDGWCAAGGLVEPGNGHSVPVRDGDARSAGTFRRELITALSDVEASSHRLIDTRDPEEWDGSFAHECCQRSGRLPGSDYLFYAEFLENGRYISTERIAGIAGGLGLKRHQKVVLYCHRGARAATVFYGLKAAGFTDLSIYTGGWHEWANRPDLPIIRDRPRERLTI